MSREPGTKPATLYDVARVAGVSHQTVSRYLRGKPGIRPDTKGKVEAALSALDYQANITARNLRTGRTGMISLAIPSLNQPYFAELAQSVIHEARRVGLTVFVETTENDRDRELAVVSRSRGDLVDAVIFAPTILTADDLADLKIGFPVVLLGDRIVNSEFDHVAMANSEGARAATKHLLDIGCRRIAVVGVEPPGRDGAAALRLEGYQRALADAGIAYNPRLAIDSGEWLKESGVRAVETLLASGEAFDAIFGFNDALALGALRGLLRAGKRVPKDVAVVGFDDTQDGVYSTPSLTSVAPNREAIARLAIDLVTSRFEDRSVPQREIQADFHLVTRESTLG